MLEHQELNFITNILKATLSVNVTITSSSYRSFQTIDYGLRNKIWKNFYSKERITQTLDALENNIIYCIADSFGTSFALTRLPTDPEHYLTIGPYIECGVDQSFIEKVIAVNQLSPDMSSPLKEYYNQVPLLDSQIFITTLHSIGAYLFGEDNNYTIAFVTEYLKPNDLDVDFYPNPALQLSMDLIEQRYRIENNLLTGIMKGNRMLAFQAFKQFQTFRLSPRNNILRDGKNNLIILNTLCRKAAEQCMVHPIYLDDISHTFAIKIEKLTSQRENDLLASEMIHKYCILVKNRSLHHYSPAVRKAMNHINFNLNKPLSLKEVAAAMNMNSNYLSTIFRKETNITLTDYINQQKIHHSLKLLNTTDMQIQNIAWSVGIHDVNYFTKLFKKLIGYTPTDYRKRIGIHPSYTTTSEDNLKNQV